MHISNSVQDIQSKLLVWFLKNGRHWIPWKLNGNKSIPKSREILSPYGIWIAEVMLQQTQLKVVIPYWEKWMKNFPTLNDLAEADLQAVLLQWQGLGYYLRAKNIHKSSKLLIELIGQDKSLDPYMWPVELDQWMALPGIGRSTAGSIISSAFDLPEPILDGNVKRIFARLLATKKTFIQDRQRLWKISFQLLPLDRPRNFNQALMDLGALVCTVKNPSCSVCPLQNYCLAYMKYEPNDFPKKNMKKTIPLEEIGLGLVFNKRGELLIAKRLEGSSMGGMWEFPGGKKELDESIEKTIEREIKEEVGIEVDIYEKLLSFEHSYSHKKLNFTVYLCQWISGEPKSLASQEILWVSPKRLFNFPFPAANTKIIYELQKYLGIDNKSY